MSKIIITDEQAEAVIRGYARLTKTSHIAPRRLLRMKQALQDAFNAREVIKTKSTQDLEDMWVGQIAAGIVSNEGHIEKISNKTKGIMSLQEAIARECYIVVDALLAERERRLNNGN